MHLQVCHQSSLPLDSFDLEASTIGSKIAQETYALVHLSQVVQVHSDEMGVTSEWHLVKTACLICSGDPLDLACERSYLCFKTPQSD